MSMAQRRKNSSSPEPFVSNGQAVKRDAVSKAERKDFRELLESEMLSESARENLRRWREKEKKIYEKERAEKAEIDAQRAKEMDVITGRYNEERALLKAQELLQWDWDNIPYFLNIGPDLLWQVLDMAKPDHLTWHNPTLSTWWRSTVNEFVNKWRQETREQKQRAQDAYDKYISKHPDRKDRESEYRKWMAIFEKEDERAERFREAAMRTDRVDWDLLRNILHPEQVPNPTEIGIRNSVEDLQSAMVEELVDLEIEHSPTIQENGVSEPEQIMPSAMPPGPAMVQELVDLETNESPTIQENGASEPEQIMPSAMPPRPATPPPIVHQAQVKPVVSAEKPSQPSAPNNNLEPSNRDPISRKPTAAQIWSGIGILVGLPILGTTVWSYLKRRKKQKGKLEERSHARGWKMEIEK
jgi:hypothetical protein